MRRPRTARWGRPYLKLIRLRRFGGVGFRHDRAAGDRMTGTRKGLDKTNVKPSLRRIFTRPDGRRVRR